MKSYFTHLIEQALSVRLQEKKDHIIKKLDLEDAEKEEMINFFKTHSNLESKVDWSDSADNIYASFIKLKSENQDSRSNKKKAIKQKLSLAFEPIKDDVKVWYEDQEIIFVSPLNYRASQFMRTVYNKSAHWCISTDEKKYWMTYVGRNYDAFCLIYLPRLNEKFMLEIYDGEGSSATLWNEDDNDIIQNEDIEYIMGYFNKLYKNNEIRINLPPEKRSEGFFNYLWDSFDLDTLFDKCRDIFENDVRVNLDQDTYLELEERYKAILNNFEQGAASFVDSFMEIQNFNIDNEEALDACFPSQFMEDAKIAMREKYFRYNQYNKEDLENLASLILYEELFVYIKGKPEADEKVEAKVQSIINEWNRNREIQQGQRLFDFMDEDEYDDEYDEDELDESIFNKALRLRRER